MAEFFNTTAVARENVLDFITSLGLDPNEVISLRVDYDTIVVHVFAGASSERTLSGDPTGAPQVETLYIKIAEED